MEDEIEISDDKSLMEAITQAFQVPEEEQPMIKILIHESEPKS